MPPTSSPISQFLPSISAPNISAIPSLIDPVSNAFSLSSGFAARANSTILDIIACENSCPTTSFAVAKDISP
jgi:hypothetical protein